MEEWSEFLTQSSITEMVKLALIPDISQLLSPFNNGDYYLCFLAYPKEKEE